MDLQPYYDSLLRKLQLLSIPIIIKRELKYALSLILFLIISSFVFLNLLGPSRPEFLLRIGFLSQILPSNKKTALGACDYSYGTWVWDETYPLRLYTENCTFLDPGFRCCQNGRQDDDYLKWRWQPEGCDLPRFNASSLLERSRNGRIVFAGDSIGRNQWESLVCLLSQVISNKSTVYEENGNPITKHKGFLSIRFDNYNLTVEYYRVPFLVTINRPPKNSSSQIRSTARVDKLHWRSSQWVGADVLVFSAGHWWNQDKTTKMYELRYLLK